MQRMTDRLLVRFGDKFGTVVVHIWKPENSSKSVFCIHGIDGNGSEFDYLASFLVKNGYTVLCPDMIGHGTSTYFGNPNMYTMEHYLTCLGALSKYASNENHFIGTSWGGAICLYFLYMTRIKVTKLILNDISLRRNSSVDETIKFIVADSQRLFDTPEEAQHYVRQSRQHLTDIPENLWPTYLKNKIAYSEGKFRVAYDPATIRPIQQFVENKNFDLCPLLEKIGAEVLLLFGERSSYYDRDIVSNLMRRRPNIACIADLKAAHPPSLMTYEQALLITGFLSM
jgi:pimeloyl-ACP methyl ester carboxylesterase